MILEHEKQVERFQSANYEEKHDEHFSPHDDETHFSLFWVSAIVLDHSVSAAVSAHLSFFFIFFYIPNPHSPFIRGGLENKNKK